MRVGRTVEDEVPQGDDGPRHGQLRLRTQVVAKASRDFFAVNVLAAAVAAAAKAETAAMPEVPPIY